MSTINRYKRGICIFAFNSSHADYVAMARLAASRVKRHLSSVPVCLITDKIVELGDEFDDIRIVSHPDPKGSARQLTSTTVVPYLNQNRTLAYFLSPYDETIILDADYLVGSDKLSQLWNSKSCLLIPNTAIDFSDGTTIEMPIAEGDTNAVWATIIYFRKCSFTRMFFYAAIQVAKNWDYYVDLYKIPSTMFRNDFCFAIALQTMCTWEEKTMQEFYMPLHVVTAPWRYRVHGVENDNIWFYVSEDDTKYYIPHTGDIHVIAKDSLLSWLYNKEVEA